MADICLIFVLFEFEAKLNQKQGNRFFFIQPADRLLFSNTRTTQME